MFDLRLPQFVVVVAIFVMMILSMVTPTISSSTSSSTSTLTFLKITTPSSRPRKKRSVTWGVQSSRWNVNTTTTLSKTTTTTAEAIFIHTIRGGETTEDETTTEVVVPTSTMSIPAGLVGVLDLRPDDVKTASSSALLSSSIFASAISDDQTDDQSTVTTKAMIVSESDIGIFPASPSSSVFQNDYGDNEGYSSIDGNDNNDNEAVAAETVGMLCNSIYLLVSYNPIAGTTVLHRNAGVQLVSLINGIRQQQQNHSDSNNKIHLKLLLFRDTRQEQQQEKEDETETSTNSEWNSQGADFLVDRIRTFYAMSHDSSSANQQSDDTNDTDATASDPFETVAIEPLWITSFSSSPEGQSEIAIAREEILSTTRIVGDATGANSGGKNNKKDGNSDTWSNIQEMYDSMGGKGKIVIHNR